MASNTHSTAGAQQLPLKDKVAIVTGSSRGIGAELALELARRGAKVTVNYTSPKSESLAKDVVSQIEALGSQAIAVRADLSTLDAGDKLVAATQKAFGKPIDILVNNAGVEIQTLVAEATAEDFAKVFDINVRGSLLMAKAVVPHLRAPGRIINISSIGSRLGYSRFALYCASKAALEGLTRCLAAELGGAGHTVNAVLPGATQSEMLDEVPKEMVELQMKMTPVQNRVATGGDIAQVVAWLAEEQSRWISGQCISTSGGFLQL